VRGSNPKNSFSTEPEQAGPSPRPGIADTSAIADQRDFLHTRICYDGAATLLELLEAAARAVVVATDLWRQARFDLLFRLGTHELAKIEELFDLIGFHAHPHAPASRLSKADNLLGLLRGLHTTTAGRRGLPNLATSASMIANCRVMLPRNWAPNTAAEEIRAKARVIAGSRAVPRFSARGVSKRRSHLALCPPADLRQFDAPRLVRSLVDRSSAILHPRAMAHTAEIPSHLRVRLKNRPARFIGAFPCSGSRAIAAH
jgi:hypothetical protein